MTLNVEFVDQIRCYWITDPMNEGMHDYPLSCTYLDNCILNPDGSIIKYKQQNSDDNIDVVEADKAIYLGYMLNIWGHCITDNLKKLWFLETEECKQLLSEGYKFYCTLHGQDKKLSKNFCKLCTYLGFDANCIHVIAKPTRFTSFVEPDSTLDKNHKSHIKYKQVVENIRSNIQYNEALPKKIYFSRTQLKNGRDFGEKYVEEVFRKLGYTIVFPEKTPLDTQLQMIYSCDSFAATEGSISHNNMFCRSDAEAIIIRKTRSCNRYQYSANFASGCNLCYIDSHLSIFNIFDNAFGPFFMYVNDNLADFANSRGLEIKKHFPVLTFFKYLKNVIWYALRYRRKVLPIGDFEFYWKRLLQDFRL